MKVISVHERPVYIYGGGIYPAYPSVITKLFGLADHILYCVSDFEEITKERAKKMERLDSDKIQFVQVYRINSVETLLKRTRLNRRILEKIIADVDMVVARLPSFTGLQAVKIAKRMGKPYMTEVIGCAWDGYWYYNWKGKILAPFMFLATRKAILNASHSVYVTDKWLQYRYPCDGKTIGVSNVNIKPNTEDVLRRRLNRIAAMKQGEPINLATCAGISNPVKGHEYVIKAMSVVNKAGANYHYYAIGDGDKSRLEKIAADLGVAECVHFTGRLTFDQICDMLDQTDIYIQPSRQEGLPRALIEAIHQGCPALGSRTAGIPELLDEEYIFDKANVAQIIALLKNFDKERMAEQAKRNFEFSKRYVTIVLAKKRNDFFTEFLADYNLKHSTL